MKSFRKILRSSKGASLIEVLIGLFLAGLVTAAIFELYINQHKQWSIQEDRTEIQQNARAAIDELTRTVRMAGHALPIGLSAVEAFNTNPDTITINFVEDECQAVLTAAMGSYGAALACDSQDLSCFYDGQWAYIFQPDSGGGEFFEISGVDSANWLISHTSMNMSKAYPKDAIVLALQRMKYFIDYSDSLHPNLMLELPGQNPAVYAENVTDFQVRYRMKNGIMVDVPPIVADVRAVEIVLTARSAEPDPDMPSDPYRSQVYTSMINLRNLDI